MGFYVHPSVACLAKGNYESWRHGIVIHLRCLDMLPYLYGLIPEPATSRGKPAWDNFTDNVVGVICSSVDYGTMCSILDLECPRALSTRLWEIFGDPHISPFPEDLEGDCLLPLANANFMPYDDDARGA